ncbi:MAG: carbohydrate porin, partial [Candidatus Zixiibacteriota bacterium]
MRKDHRNMWLGMIMGIIFILSGSGWADEVKGSAGATDLKQLEKRVSELEEKVKEEEEKAKKWEDIKQSLGRFKIGGGITGIVQGTLNNDKNPPPSKLARGVRESGIHREDVIDGTYSVDLELEVDLNGYGRALVHLEGGQGKGVGRKLSGFVCRGHGEAKPIFTGVNADALGDDGKPTIAETYWEIPLFNKKLIATLGKLDPKAYFDGNAVANDETTQFMADIFVNNIAMDWPDNTGGLRVTLNPYGIVEINLGVLSGDGDYNDIFKRPFAIGEINLKPKFFGELQGNYRFYYWVNGRRHMTWKNPYAKEKSKGFGLSVGQQITPEITLFARYGIQDENIKYDCEEYSLRIKNAWSLGGQINGKFWGREDDNFAIAYGQARPMDELKKRMRKAGAKPTNEGHLEAYYRLALGKYVALSPDFQVIFNSSGNKKSDTVYIGG